MGDAQIFLEEAEFDELGRLKTILGSNGQTSAFRYDEEDQLSTTTDPTLLVSTNAYDALKQLVQTVDRDAGTTLMEHDETDQMTRYTDPRGIDTGFVYNGFGDVIEETSADRGTMTYSYDSRGLVTEMTDARGIVSTYEYDDGGRITARRFPSAPVEDQTFAYDGTAGGSEGEGKIHLISDQSGSIERQYANGGYVSLDRRTIEGTAYDTSYQVDNQGRLTEMVTPGGLAVSYTHDAEDRVYDITVQRRVIDPATGAFPPPVTVVSGLTYLPFGPLNAMTYGDGGQHARTYDSSYRLTRLFDTRLGTDLRDVTYGWTQRDNLASATDALDPSKSETFQYTNREFLREAIGEYGELDYTYDAVGNRTSQALYQNASVVTDIYAYPITSNKLDQITQGAGGNRSFTYDAAGNTTFDSRGGGYGYAYNAASRMESVSLGGVIQAEYLYNALGQQVVRRLTQDAKTIHSIHDLDGNRIAEYEIDAFDGTSTLLREYVWLEGAPVAVVEGNQVYFIRTDHIGRPVFATDSAGTKVWEASYTPFGEVETSTGDAIALRFPGQWFQSEAGLHQNWMRDYDPTTGRYIQADPLGLVAGVSLYGYARQNPGAYVDPDGEHPLLWAAAFGAGAALWNLWDQLDNNNWMWECVNPWRVAGAGLIGAVGSGAGAFAGKAIPGLLKGLPRGYNRHKGDFGNWLSRVSNRLKGNKLISREATPPGLTTRADSFWRARDGSTFYVESKFGTSGLTRAQRAAAKALGSRYRIERWTYPWLGRQLGRGGAGLGGLPRFAVPNYSGGNCECANR